MSKNELPNLNGRPDLQEVRVEVLTHKPSRNSQNPTTVIHADNEGISKLSSGSSNYVYVNTAYVGSLNNLQTRNARVDRLPEPPTSVVREQYWACTKWPYGQRLLAVAVGVLLGAVIALAITLALNKGDVDLIPGLLRTDSAQF
ncbi:uncharacterized protein ACR2FA_006779 [Aphomia sociella]